VTAILDWLSPRPAESVCVTQLVIYTLVITHITIVGVTVYLHRHSAHRAVDLHPVLKHFFRFWLWMTTSMNTKEWTAIHRKHHATCETGRRSAQPAGAGHQEDLLGRRRGLSCAAATPETLKRFGSGTPDDWLERNVYTPFNVSASALMLIINVALFGVLGLTVWAVQMLWIPVMAAGVINGIGHYWGYRNFECHDAARNIVPWGIVIGGEELHNNHHTYPNSAKLSQKPWEFDIGWMYIRLFELLGLAKARSTGPVVARCRARTTLDVDTAWAVLNDRFRLMAKYAETVVGAAGRAGTGSRRQGPPQRGAHRASRALSRRLAGGRSRASTHQRDPRRQPAPADHLRVQAAPAGRVGEARRQCRRAAARTQAVVRRRRGDRHPGPQRLRQEIRSYTIPSSPA
jgi:stearoyl-CoA desaturase (Delta-9 desaturase)